MRVSFLQKRSALIAAFALLLVLITLLFKQQDSSHAPSQDENLTSANKLVNSGTQESKLNAENSNLNQLPLAQEKAQEDTFLKSLIACRPDIASQGVASPDALIAYLQNHIGFASTSTDIENYIIRLPDGSERRIHLVGIDSSNSSAPQRELRYFKLDTEGYPERIALNKKISMNPSSQTIENFVHQGSLVLHQLKTSTNLKDSSWLKLDSRNNQVYEFQLRGRLHTLSCRVKNCYCN